MESREEGQEEGKRWVWESGGLKDGALKQYRGRARYRCSKEHSECSCRKNALSCSRPSASQYSKCPYFPNRRKGAKRMLDRNLRLAARSVAETRASSDSELTDEDPPPSPSSCSPSSPHPPPGPSPSSPSPALPQKPPSSSPPTSSSLSSHRPRSNQQKRVDRGRRWWCDDRWICR